MEPKHGPFEYRESSPQGHSAVLSALRRTSQHDTEAAGQHAKDGTKTIHRATPVYEFGL